MTKADRIARIRIELEDVEPTIWRRFEIPLTVSLKQLHEAIQAVMLFEDCHLFQFVIDGRRYGMPNPEWDDIGGMVDARNIKLGALADRGVRTFSYTYDLGDDWRHTVTIEAVSSADPEHDYPRFIDGARRAPPEDVGGIPGFEEFVSAMTRPRHPERKRLRKWYGRHFDPDDIDVPTITARLGSLAGRRPRGKAGEAKSRGSTH